MSLFSVDKSVEVRRILFLAGILFTKYLFIRFCFSPFLTSKLTGMVATVWPGWDFLCRVWDSQNFMLVQKKHVF